jgi:hypothetical protein
MLTGKLARHPQPVGLLLQEGRQLIVGEFTTFCRKDFRNLRLMREVVEALCRAVIDAVDVRLQQWRVPDRQEFVSGRHAGSPDIVPVVVEDDSSSAMGGLAPGGAGQSRIFRIHRSPAQRARAEQRTACCGTDQEFASIRVHDSSGSAVCLIGTVGSECVAAAGVLSLEFAIFGFQDNPHLGETSRLAGCQVG